MIVQIITSAGYILVTFYMIASVLARYEKDYSESTYYIAHALFILYLLDNYITPKGTQP